jgi:hypothetical protein
MIVSADTVTNQDLLNGNFTGVLGLACKPSALPALALS